MSLEGNFSEAVRSNDVRGVRIMMKNSILADRTFEEFDEMEHEARSMTGLYDPHDGEPFITDKSRWDEDYMNDQMVQVVRNFSHERLEHLKSIVRYLYPVVKRTTSSTQSQKRPYMGTGPEPSFKEQYERDKAEGKVKNVVAGAVGGAAIGAAAGAVVAVAASSVVAVGVGIGAVAGAAVGAGIGVATGGNKN